MHGEGLYQRCGALQTFGSLFELLYFRCCTHILGAFACRALFTYNSSVPRRQPYNPSSSSSSNLPFWSSKFCSERVGSGRWWCCWWSGTQNTYFASFSVSQPEPPPGLCTLLVWDGEEEDWWWAQGGGRSENTLLVWPLCITLTKSEQLSKDTDIISSETYVLFNSAQQFFMHFSSSATSNCFCCCCCCCGLVLFAFYTSVSHDGRTPHGPVESRLKDSPARAFDYYFDHCKLALTLLARECPRFSKYTKKTFSGLNSSKFW